MSSDAAAAMYPDLAKREQPSAKGQGSTWGVNVAQAMYGKREAPPKPVVGRRKVELTYENVGRIPGLKPNTNPQIE
jgi:hypothetical protein